MSTTERVSATRLVVRPSGRPRRRGVLFCHGNGQGSDIAVTASLTGQRRLIHAIADAGHVVMCDQLGATMTEWGKDAFLAYADEAVAALRAQPGVVGGPFHLGGVSMGFQTAAVWARLHRGDVASIFGILPVTDVADIVANDPFGLAAVIHANYGGAYSTATHGPTKDPNVFFPDITSLAMKLWYGLSDIVTLPARVAAFVAASGADAVSLVGGHAEATVQAVPTNDVVAWLRANDS